MTESTPEPANAPPEPPAAQPDDPATPPSEPPDTTDWKAEARKWEDRAKANKKAADDLERQRLSALSDAERQIEEAKAAGRSEVVSAFGQRLARTEFTALAARRNAEFDVASALEFVDLTRFVGDDGEPDTKAIEAAVQRLVPEPSNGLPSFDGGTRTTSPAPAGMTQLIRKAAGRA